MSAKITASRRAAFLKFLAATGNQTLSAERAKVSRSWVCLQRSTDPGFDAACREALRVAKAALGPSTFQCSSVPRTECALQPRTNGAGVGPHRLPPRWGFAEGVELVISGSNGRRTQIRRAKFREWTPRVELRFLDVLCETANVRVAAAAAGMSKSSAYAHRRRHPEFMRLWDEAITIGYAMLDAALVAGAVAYMEGGPAELDGAVRVTSIGEAIKVLTMKPRPSTPRQARDRPSSG